MGTPSSKGVLSISTLDYPHSSVNTCFNYPHTHTLAYTHRAVHQEGAKCLELLLKSDHTYFKDHKGRTVLHLSAEVGCMAACELVLLGLRSDAVHDLDRMVRNHL